jgi:RNase P subunit RPR2
MLNRIRRYFCRNCHGSGVETLRLVVSGEEIEVKCWHCVAAGRIEPGVEVGGR